MGLKWGRQPLWIGGWTITCPGCWWRGSWKIPISSFEVHISRLCITTGQPTVWGGEALVYGVHWLSVLVLRIRDAEAGGGPFAFCVLDGRQLLIYKKCKSTPPPPPPPPPLWGCGEDHAVLMSGSEILLKEGWLTGPKKQSTELSPEVQLHVPLSWRGVSLHLRRLSSWCSASQFLYIGLRFLF